MASSNKNLMKSILFLLLCSLHHSSSNTANEGNPEINVTTNPENTVLTQTITTSTSHKSEDNILTDSDAETVSVIYIDSLHIVLTVTITILCCLCIAFTVIFLKIYKYQQIVNISKAKQSTDSMDMASTPTSNGSSTLEIMPTHQLAINVDMLMIPSFTEDNGSRSSSNHNAMQKIEEEQDDQKELEMEDTTNTTHRRPKLSAGEANHSFSLDVDENEDSLYQPPTKEDIRRATMQDVTTPNGDDEKANDQDLSHLLRVTSKIINEKGLENKLKMADIDSGASDAIYGAGQSTDGGPIEAHAFNKKLAVMKPPELSTADSNDDGENARIWKD